MNSIITKSRFMSSGYRFFFFMLSLFMSFEMSARTVHWITFIDTEDEHVGILNNNARKVLYSHFIDVVNKQVSQYGYDHKIYDCYNTSYTPDNCLRIIRNLQCYPTDIIMFYYIGHGFQGSNDLQDSKYPFCTFGYQPEKSIPLTWIHNELKKKSVQLVVSIGVCSNAPMEIGSAPSTKTVLFLPTKNEEDLSTTVAGAFLGNKGDVIVCSASPGQQSFGGPTNLGNMDYFTYTFVSCFEHMSLEQKFDWGFFLKEVSKATSEIAKSSPFNKVQIPIYDCNLLPTKIPELINK